MNNTDKNQENAEYFLNIFGTILGGSIHKINNLLTGISANASLVGLLSHRAGEVSGRLDEVSVRIEETVDLIDQLLTHIVDFIHPELASDLFTSNLGELLKSSEILLKIILGSRITARTRVDRGLPTLVMKPHQLSQLLYWLASYAYQVVDGEGSVVLYCRKSQDGCLAIEMIINKVTPEQSEVPGTNTPSIHLPNLAPKTAEELLFFVEKKINQNQGFLVVTNPSENSMSLLITLPVVSNKAPFAVSGSLENQ